MHQKYFRKLIAALQWIYIDSFERERSQMRKVRISMKIF